MSEKGKLEELMRQCRELEKRLENWCKPKDPPRGKNKMPPLDLDPKTWRVKQ